MVGLDDRSAYLFWYMDQLAKERWITYCIISGVFSQLESCMTSRDFLAIDNQVRVFPAKDVLFSWLE
jgi:hypothetical protein